MRTRLSRWAEKCRTLTSAATGSGRWLQDIIGYQRFFIWMMLATIPAFIAVKLIPLDAQFARKEQSQ